MAASPRVTVETDSVYSMRNDHQMWIRSVRWVANDGGGVRGSFMPPRERRTVDTAILTPDTLAGLLPTTGAALFEVGSLVVEFVVVDDDAENLRPWLEVCSPVSAADVTDYIFLNRPVSSMYQAFVDKGEIVNSANAHFRGFQVPELSFETSAPRDPRVVVRPVRTVDNSRVLLVFWRRAWAYPVRPKQREQDLLFGREFPGKVVRVDPIADAIARGVPERQARFAHDRGGLGPRLFDQAVGQFDTAPANGPGIIGEGLLRGLAENLAEAATVTLPVARDQWEADLLAGLRGSKQGAAGDGKALALLGGAADILREARDEIAEPYDHAERYWYAKAPDSPVIDTKLTETLTALDSFAERLRSALALASVVTSSEILRLQQEAADQGEQFQATLTIIGALILGPSLVFGLFGTNVPLPLEHSWWGFGLMLGLAAATTYATWVLLARVRRSRFGDRP